jgi:hypothetical protein
MSIQATFSRIAELQSALGGPAAPAAAPAAAPRATAAATATPAFAGQLQSAFGGAGASAAAFNTTPIAGGSPAGQAIVNLVRNEVGQAESPPGSNDSGRIAQYRQSTAGAMAGAPWCAYFTSWAAREAGVPLGDTGQGFGAVADVWDWAQRSGKAIPAGSTPQPGDLIIWDGRHMGVVEAVGADGSVQTIEGNSSDAVTRRTYGPDGGGASGYVRLG